VLLLFMLLAFPTVGSCEIGVSSSELSPMVPTASPGNADSAREKDFLPSRGPSSLGRPKSCKRQSEETLVMTHLQLFDFRNILL
jgi:hypothetical protein